MMELSFPPKPTFSEELIESCKKNKVGMPIAFEWYKYVGTICNITANIHSSSPTLKSIPSIHFAILTGLLNRCSRLILSNLRLGAKEMAGDPPKSLRSHGETTRLLDRCIVETATKLRWLCLKDSDEYFNRYIADGLKSDLSLKDEILQRIQARGGKQLVIEKRMLRSIQDCFDASNLTESQVQMAKKLPDLASMNRDLNLTTLDYVIYQRMGSHWIHGTWTDLLFNYLEQDKDKDWHPRNTEVEFHENQTVFVAVLVTEALTDFAQYVIDDKKMAETTIDFYEGVKESVLDLRAFWGTEDYEFV